MFGLPSMAARQREESLASACFPAAQFLVESGETSYARKPSSTTAAGPAPCGRSKDRWCRSWQITLRALTAAIRDPDRSAATRAFAAMMQMAKIDIAAIEAARLC
jgi:predicted 3-demethylubiquinone-9 3-methyltransferase (glyoxalase superfamily)